MKKTLSIEEIRALDPALNPAVIKEHLDSLDEDYFSFFSKQDILEHLHTLSTLSEDTPSAFLLTSNPENTIICTVLAFDFPSVFSLITGLFSATGFDIVSGKIFTYSRKGPSPHVNRRKIIDVFTGKLTRDISIGTWKDEFQKGLKQLFGFLLSGDNDGITRAKHWITEKVVSSYPVVSVDSGKTLLPVRIKNISIGERLTKISIEAENTPFFLFALSNALSFHDISIENVHISTTGTRVKDEIEIADLAGNPVTDPEILNRITISILFTKQFTYFLKAAPDPYTAFIRFEDIIQQVEDRSSHKFFTTFLKNPQFLDDLARLLGTSDFLWADFLRSQYESILPMLAPEIKKKHFSHPSIELTSRLDKLLSEAQSKEDEKRILNDFKNREIYLIDLDHILSEGMDFLLLSQKLTVLAEIIVNKSLALAWKQLKRRYGTPVTFAGLDATYAVMGLGKFGGAALGYASDIELLFIYSDSGSTDGKESISNADFFERLFKEAIRFLEAKREGIFHIDLRLRPFGKNSPIACSLENFFRYFGKDGEAHSVERLALIRMRAVAGDHELGRRIERIRDEIIYASDDIDLQSLRDLRQRQFLEKRVPGKLNAKFSPGGLVDLEYTVQILQCLHGKNNTNLRTPKIHVALDELAKAGVMSRDEASDLTETYYFFRKLINGLRMLRGNAKDLFLPDIGSEEYVHLARRTGYTETSGILSPAQRLHLEFETKAATIRVFIESHFGRESIPGPPVGNAADLVLSDSLPKELQNKILLSGGITDFKRGYANIKTLAGEGKTRNIFARLSILAWDVLGKTPDPDMALNNWERFTKSLTDTQDHYKGLLSQPKQLEILLDIFSGSQFLSDILIQNFDFFEWVSDPSHLHQVRSLENMKKDLAAIISNLLSDSDWLSELRRFRKREILRIGTRDICLGKPITEIFDELSNLAEAILDSVLEKRWKSVYGSYPINESGFTIFAFGKLGGKELNYSSDIDLLGVADTDIFPGEKGDFIQNCSRIMEQSGRDLAGYTEEGYVYRVDYRLRPYGRAGGLVQSRDSVLHYYENEAALWEHQALLKLRPVAGDMVMGKSLIQNLGKTILKEKAPAEVISSIDTLRTKTIQTENPLPAGVDIKNGKGGIRDIEFLVQGLQMIHARAYPHIITGNTLEGIYSLEKESFIPEESALSLEKDYIFLRRVEHFLQIYDDRQTHRLPRGKKALDSLARRLKKSTEIEGDPLTYLENTLVRVRENYRVLLLGFSDSPP